MSIKDRNVLVALGGELVSSGEAKYACTDNHNMAIFIHGY